MKRCLLQKLWFWPNANLDHHFAALLSLLFVVVWFSESLQFLSLIPVMRGVSSLLLAGIVVLLCLKQSQGGASDGKTREKSELCPDPSLGPLNVFIALKTTTATPVYSGRTSTIMSSWGSYATGNLALITDGIGPKHNEALAHAYPSLPIIEVKGSEKFGEYRHGPQHRHIGYNSQRIKVRSLIKWFSSNLRENSGIEWLCYIDDDMYVNVNNLNVELSRVVANPPSTCSRMDRCVIADVGPIKISDGNTVNYSNAVWCMTVATVQAVNHMFLTKNDVELDWTGDMGSDDVGFARMMKRNLNITFTDNLSMFSINNKVAVTPTGRRDNPEGSYTIRKANIRGDPGEWLYLNDNKAAADVLARLSVLNLPHVNYTELCERHGAHKLPYGTNPRLIVDMKQWNAYVNPQWPCRQALNMTLKLASSSSYILKYSL